MLTRFELMVILRNQVADRRLVRRALAVEATLEEWAAEVPDADVAAWAMAGLGANIDAELLAAGSAERRGQVAEELLLTEGAHPEIAAAARLRLGRDVDAMPILAAAVAAGEAIVDEIYGALMLGDKLDDLEPRAVSHRLSRAADKRGDEDAIRTLALLERIGIPVERAAELALAGMLRVREDLRL
jgi:predicted hydrolase (HD superfamily)